MNIKSSSSYLQSSLVIKCSHNSPSHFFFLFPFSSSLIFLFSQLPLSRSNSTSLEYLQKQGCGRQKCLRLFHDKRLQKEIFLGAQKQINLRRHRNQQAKAHLPLYSWPRGPCHFSLREQSLLHSCTFSFSISTSTFSLPFSLVHCPLPLCIKLTCNIIEPSSSHVCHILHHQYQNLRPTPSLALPLPLKSLDLLRSHSE